MIDEIEEKKELTISSSMEEFEKSIVDESSVESFDKIKSLFDISMRKKELIRLGRLSNLQDRTLDEMCSRIENHSDEFNNKDLIDYFKVVQDTLNKSSSDADGEISFTQNNIVNNIEVKDGVSQLDADSRMKVIDAVKEILRRVSEEVKEKNDIIIIDEPEEEEQT